MNTTSSWEGKLEKEGWLFCNFCRMILRWDSGATWTCKFAFTCSCSDEPRKVLYFTSIERTEKEVLARFFGVRWNRDECYWRAGSLWKRSEGFTLRGDDSSAGDELWSWRPEFCRLYRAVEFHTLPLPNAWYCCIVIFSIVVEARTCAGHCYLSQIWHFPSKILFGRYNSKWSSGQKLSISPIVSSFLVFLFQNLTLSHQVFLCDLPGFENIDIELLCKGFRLVRTSWL
jgi:hypothetical protein